MDRHKGGVYICTANNGVGEPALSQVSVHVLCECSFVFIKIIYKINSVYTFNIILLDISIFDFVVIISLSKLIWQRGKLFSILYRATSVSGH